MNVKKIKKCMICFSLVSALLPGITSCDSGSAIRKYKEKNPTVKPGAAGTPMTPAPIGQPQSTRFQWETPEGWSENRTASGMRLATFTVKSGNKESLCTIIPLRGEAGGLEANVDRWLTQVTGTAETPRQKKEAIEKLLETQEKFLTKGQLPTTLVDFTPVTANPSDPSIIVAVIKAGATSIFIKMTGEKNQLIKNKKKFKALCRSFRFMPQAAHRHEKRGDKKLLFARQNYRTRLLSSYPGQDILRYLESKLTGVLV